MELRRQTPARCPLIYPHLPSRSIATDPYFDNISMGCVRGIISPFPGMAWRNRIDRGGVRYELILTFRADGDVGDRKSFAQLDQPGFGQKVLLRRTFEE